MDGIKGKRSLDSPHETKDELIERFVKEKGWYVPAIHEKYLDSKEVFD